jgi:hypothetical protein
LESIYEQAEGPAKSEISKGQAKAPANSKEALDARITHSILLKAMGQAEEGPQKGAGGCLSIFEGHSMVSKIALKKLDSGPESGLGEK